MLSDLWVFLGKIYQDWVGKMTGGLIAIGIAWASFLSPSRFPTIFFAAAAVALFVAAFKTWRDEYRGAVDPLQVVRQRDFDRIIASLNDTEKQMVRAVVRQGFGNNMMWDSAIAKRTGFFFPEGGRLVINPSFKIELEKWTAATDPETDSKKI